MLYLENKLHLFRKIVYEKRAEGNLQELESLNKQCEKEYKERKIEFEKQREEMVFRRKKLAENRYNQEMAKIDEGDKIARLQKDEELLEDLIQGLKERMNIFVETEDYYSYMKELFLKIVAELDKGKYRLEVLEKDRSWWMGLLNQDFEEKEFQLETMDVSGLGGFCISDSKQSYQIDNSLLGILEDHRYEIGKLLHNTLRGETLE